MDVTLLLEKCRELGATITPLSDRFKVQAPEPLPDDIIADLKQAKFEILAKLRHQKRIQADCWMLEEWYRLSLPEWRSILQESIDSNNANREEYARWMLREILEDSEYTEEA